MPAVRVYSSCFLSASVSPNTGCWVRQEAIAIQAYTEQASRKYGNINSSTCRNLCDVPCLVISVILHHCRRFRVGRGRGSTHACMHARAPNTFRRALCLVEFWDAHSHTVYAVTCPIQGWLGLSLPWYDAPHVVWTVRINSEHASGGALYIYVLDGSTFVSV